MLVGGVDRCLVPPSLCLWPNSEQTAAAGCCSHPAHSSFPGGWEYLSTPPHAASQGNGHLGLSSVECHLAWLLSVWLWLHLPTSWSSVQPKHVSVPRTQSLTPRPPTLTFSVTSTPTSVAQLRLSASFPSADARVRPPSTLLSHPSLPAWNPEPGGHSLPHRALAESPLTCPPFLPAPPPTSHGHPLGGLSGARNPRTLLQMASLLVEDLPCAGGQMCLGERAAVGIPAGQSWSWSCHPWGLGLWLWQEGRGKLSAQCPQAG